MSESLSFTKMHGCGNDYIYINCFEEHVQDPAALAVRLSDRHKGIGGDGVILLCPPEHPEENHARMRMFNLDGSEGKMCGNGIRCVAKLSHDSGAVPAEEKTLRIETLSGVKTCLLGEESGNLRQVTVDMGAPILAPEAIPTTRRGEPIIALRTKMGGEERVITCVSMGNPHCVIFGGDPDAIDLERVGPPCERDPLFPEGVNTEFVQVLGERHLKMRVWERGSGETMACGTGACASAAAAVLNGFCPRGEEITVSLRGGDLRVRWDEDTLWMTGEAVTVFRGEVAAKD